MATSVADKRLAFRKLHEDGCFVLPNPWDVGTAKVLQQMGFKAIASTSSGLAWSKGLTDNHVNCDDVLRHLGELCASVDLPLNADFEAGFADDPEGVETNIRRAVAVGISGVSIEDATGRADAPLYDHALAVERVRAARAGIDVDNSGVVLVGRCEAFLVGQPDINMTIARLTTYAEAGADCLYAPGLRTKDDISAVVKALHPKPVNVLMGSPGLSVAELADLGVRRISVGGALARAAWGAFLRASQEIIEHGTFNELGHAVSFSDLNNLIASATTK